MNALQSEFCSLLGLSNSKTHILKSSRPNHTNMRIGIHITNGNTEIIESPNTVSTSMISLMCKITDLWRYILTT